MAYVQGLPKGHSNRLDAIFELPGYQEIGGRLNKFLEVVVGIIITAIIVGLTAIGLATGQ